MLAEQCKHLRCAQLGTGRSFGQEHPVCQITGKVPESGCPCGLEEYLDDREVEVRHQVFLCRSVQGSTGPALNIWYVGGRESAGVQLPLTDEQVRTIEQDLLAEGN